MPANVTAAVISEDAQQYENSHVHAVYDQIAPHFSSTRYKPWPIIKKFIESIPTGWVGLDSGTGNGKYLPLGSPEIWTIGLDRSRNLLQIAQKAGGTDRDVVWSDVLDLCVRRGAFDYAISIATIHHLATPERRRKAVERLIESVHPKHGRVMIYVWAIDQDALSKRVIPDNQSVVTDGRDVFVPWVLQSTQNKQEDQDSKSEKQIFQRYYHMFDKGELETLVQEAASNLGIHIGRKDSKGCGLEIVESGWERSNYYVELQRWS